MTLLSVIIPTRNRAAYLRDAVKSALAQTMDEARYEVIVVDNGSTDSTKSVVDKLNEDHGGRVRYFLEEEPGLHNGRHRGMREARGEVLVYIDDDVIVDPGWLAAVAGAFEDEETVLVGGKILPLWEGDVPDWLELFTTRTQQGWWLGHLSLLDFGDHKTDIDPAYVFGCNFSIRKHVLYECGGFHPDAMPQELIRYRGDGETALSATLRSRGLKAVYVPRAKVHHRIPPERLTIAYFCRRAFNQGISGSFAEIRRDGGLRRATLWRDVRRRLASLKRFVERAVARFARPPVLRQVHRAVLRGRRYHRREAARDPALLTYVLKANYYE